MVNLSIIRKRKIKKLVVIFASAAAVSVTALSAVALLGTQSSPFTVTLNNAGADLTLSENGDDTNEKTSFLLAKDVPGYQEIDGTAIDNLFDDAYLDSELTPDLVISENNEEYAVTFLFKYTFYVQNTGYNAADYLLTMNITNQTRGQSDFDLSNILRVRFYENFDLEKHEYKTYAKARTVFDDESNQYVRIPEKIPGSDEYAEVFESNKVVLTSEIKNFAPTQKVRYTFVMWLEGNDLDSAGQDAPVGSSLSLGVNISAHEAQIEASEESSPEDSQAQS